MRNIIQFLINSYFVFHKSLLTPFYGPTDHFLCTHQHFEKHTKLHHKRSRTTEFIVIFLQWRFDPNFCHDLPLRGFAITLVGHTKIGRTPLDEWSARGWDLYLPAHNSLNTFTAIVDLSRFNNPCLKLPTSTLVDLTFQSRALRSFSLNQLRNLSL